MNDYEESTAVEDAEELSPYDDVNVPQMLSDITDDLKNSADYVERMEDAADVVECFWDGQHKSGLKVPTDEDPEPFPYPYASDQRIRKAEEIVNEKVLLQKAATAGGSKVFKPVEHHDNVLAGLMSRLVTYFLEGEMAAEVRDERDYLLNWKESYGKALMHVCWETRRALEKRSISIDELVEKAVANGIAGTVLDSPPDQMTPEMEGAADNLAKLQRRRILDLVLSDEKRDELIELLMGHDPDMSKPEAKRLAQQLKEKEDGTYHAPYVISDRPKWEALLPLQDVMISPNVTNLQELPRIPRVFFLTAADVRDRAERNGWTAEQLKTVLANPGRRLDLGGYATTSWIMVGTGVKRDLTDLSELEKRYELLEVWHRQTAMAGAPAIYRTLIHASVTTGPLEHEMSPYKHGQYPFVYFARERKRRGLMEPRGIPEIVATNQWAIKAQHDARRNRTDMALSPPLIKGSNRDGSGRIVLGPNMQITEKKAGSLRYMELAKLDVDTVQITEEEHRMLDIYFGRFSKHVPESLQQLHNQTLIDDCLLDFSEVLKMMTKLIQQYVSQQRAERILGTRYTPDQTRQAIQHQWDIRVSYDVKDFDLNWLEKKAEMWTNFVIANDRLGLVNPGAFTRYMAQSLDPVAAEELVQNEEDVSRREMQEEDAALTEIFSGGEPELIIGQNHEARMKRMVEKTQMSQTRVQLMQSNPTIRAVWENRYAFHKTRTQQDITNKATGKLGGKPVLGDAATSSPFAAQA